jgi:hypothetical protein
MKKPRRLQPHARQPPEDEAAREVSWIEFLAGISGSIENRELLRRSALCGCRLCRHVFPPEAVREWVDERDGIGRTAMCPKCGLDAVIGSASPIAEEIGFLRELCRRWGLQFPVESDS